VFSFSLFSVAQVSQQVSDANVGFQFGCERMPLSGGLIETAATHGNVCSEVLYRL
jgi:hypothetical protein